MKLVSWNCNGALRKKLVEADSLSADILIVQECEDPDRSTQVYRNWAGNHIWCGQNKNKGIGVRLRISVFSVLKVSPVAVLIFIDAANKVHREYLLCVYMDFLRASLQRKWTV